MSDLSVRSDPPVAAGGRMRLAVLLLCLLLLSIALNALQVAKIRSLTRPLESCIAALRYGGGGRGSANATPIPTLVGSPAPALHMQDLAGRPVTLDVGRSAKTTVLYVFSPHCVWCKRNLPNMRALMAAAGKRFDFVPISLGAAGVSAYWAGIGARGAVYTAPSTATRSAYGLGGTPQTIVIGPDGKIVNNWSGAYTGDALAQVSSTLGVKLPGLAE